MRQAFSLFINHRIIHRALASIFPAQSERQMTPPDATFVQLVLPIGMAGTLIAGGAAYGITKQNVDSAHRRIDELAVQRFEHTKAMDRKLDRIEKTLTELSVALARITPVGHTHFRRSDHSDDHDA